MLAALVSLRLLTLNCLFRGNAAARLATLARELQGSKLDILCLQEVVWRRHVELLGAALPCFPHAAFKPFGLAAKGGLLLMSRWPISHWRYETYRRRGRWNTLGFADWLIHKGFQVVRLEVDGEAMVVINTHLLANYAEDWSRESDYALRQWDELHQLARSLATIDAGMPLVVAGDLNVPAGSWLYEDFLSSTGLRDVFDARREPTGRAELAHKQPAQAIDHVLVRLPRERQLHTSARLVFQEELRLVTGKSGHLSDHFGIEAHITMGR